MHSFEAIPNGPPELDPSEYAAWQASMAQRVDLQGQAAEQAAFKEHAAMERETQVQHLVFALDHAHFCTTQESASALLQTTVRTVPGSIGEAAIVAKGSDGGSNHKVPAHPFNQISHQIPAAQLCGIILLHTAISSTKYNTEQEQRIIRAYGNQRTPERLGRTLYPAGSMVNSTIDLLHSNHRRYTAVEVLSWLTSKNKAERVPPRLRLAKSENNLQHRNTVDFHYRHFSRHAHRGIR